MTLTEFLVARLAEEEDAARAAMERRRGRALAERSAFGVSYMVVGRADDPARALVDCKEKRRTVEDHSDDLYAEFPCLTLRTLAVQYAYHPDYRPEWRP